MSDGIVKANEKRYLLFAEDQTRAIFSLSEIIRDLAKTFLKKRGVLEITPPVLAPVTDPGLRGAKRFETAYYGKKYQLTVYGDRPAGKPSSRPKSPAVTPQ